MSRKFKCKKGESLVESIVSLFIFTTLMVAVTTMIAAALRVTGNYTEAAYAQQVSANVVLLENTSPMEIKLTITGGGIDDVEIPVNILREGNFAAFSPVAEP